VDIYDDVAAKIYLTILSSLQPSQSSEKRLVEADNRRKRPFLVPAVISNDMEIFIFWFNNF
jgi:hypothetical protein